MGDFDGTAAKVKATDTYGLVVSALGESTAQALIDAIANKVMNELINKNKIVNNLLATDASTVLAGTQGAALDKRLVAAENAVAQLNSEQRIFIDNTKIAGDSPTAFKKGITITTTGQSSSFPIGFGIVLTVFVGEGRGIQINAGPPSNPKIRVINNGIWTNWSSFA